MAFKVQIAGLQGSEILHLRPIKPWSSWDTAMTVAYFGAAAAFIATLGAQAVDLFANGFAEPTNRMEAARQATGLVIAWYSGIEGRDAYRKMKRSIEVTSAAIEKLPEISTPLLDATRKVLHEKMREYGDKRVIRFVDKTSLEHILGYHEPVNMPMACTSHSFSKEVLTIGVNPAFVQSRDALMQFVVSSHEVSHQYGWNRIPLIARALQRTNTQLVMLTLLQGAFFKDHVTLLMSVVCALTVPALLQSHYRRQEFRSDRGAAYFSDAETTGTALRSMEAQMEHSAPMNTAPLKELTQSGWKDKANDVMWVVLAKVLGTYMNSHPPIKQRKRAMKILAKRQAYLKRNLG